MHIWDSGPIDGSTIVFLHGNGTSGAMWKDHMSYFGRQYHCIAPGFPGYGKSNDQEWVSLGSTADQVIEIIERANRGSANLVGLSLGGSVAITLLAKRPDLLDRVIIDGAGVLPLPGLAFMKLGFFLLQPFLHTEFVIKTIARSMNLPNDEFPEFKQNMCLMSPSSFRRSFIQALSLRQPDGLDKIYNPVLFVAGEKEPQAVKQSNKLLACIMPKGECRIAPNMGHGWLAEECFLLFKTISMRWSKFKTKDSRLIYDIVSTRVFPFIKAMNGESSSAFSRYMQDAMFLIPTPQVLQKIITGLDELYEHDIKDLDMQGDLYEYMLSKLATAGQNGQFRTPKHIRDMMVRLLAPTPDDKICDIITTKTIQFNYPILKAS